MSTCLFSLFLYYCHYQACVYTKLGCLYFTNKLVFQTKVLGERRNSYLKTKTNLSTAHSVAIFKYEMIKISSRF